MTERTDKWRGNVVTPLFSTKSALGDSFRPSSRVVCMTPAQSARQDLQVQWLQEALAAQARRQEEPLDLKSL